MAEPSQSSPACGVHKDGTFYLRATEPGHADAIQAAAKDAGLELDHRKGPANVGGESGTYSHFHAPKAEHIRTILEKLHAGEAEGDDPPREDAGEPAGQHIHVHIHTGGSSSKSALESQDPPEGGEDKDRRSVQKAHHEASTRTSNGRVIPVKAYDDRRATRHRTPHAHQPAMLHEPERPQLHTPESVEHHRNMAEAHSLKARVASHEAQDGTSHLTARDHHYGAATAHLRAAHAMIAHGHETEHPDVQAHIKKAQHHHDRALHHYKQSRGPVDHGHQSTIDEAIQEADKREIRKALTSTIGDLLGLAQRWNTRSMEANNRHLMLHEVPGALTTARMSALAYALGGEPSAILETVGMATGHNPDYAETLACLLEEDEGSRPIAKALRTVKAHFRPDHWGHLESVTTYTRTVSDEEQKTWATKEVGRVYQNILDLLKGKHGEKMDDFGHNLHLGQISCTRKMMKHVWERRMELHRSDPATNGHPAEELRAIAMTVVLGKPTMDQSTESESEMARLWLTFRSHQVAVAPFWGPKPTADSPARPTTRCHMVTGYRMEPVRCAFMAEHGGDAALQLPLTQLPMPGHT